MTSHNYDSAIGFEILIRRNLLECAGRRIQRLYCCVKTNVAMKRNHPLMGGHRVGISRPRTPGGEEVFLKQMCSWAKWITQMSGVEGRVPHIVSTGDVPRVRHAVGRIMPQQKRRSGSEQIRSVRSEIRPCGSRTNAWRGRSVSQSGGVVGQRG